MLILMFTDTKFYEIIVFANIISIIVLRCMEGLGEIRIRNESKYRDCTGDFLFEPIGSRSLRYLSRKGRFPCGWKVFV